MPNLIGDEFAVGFSELMGNAWWKGDGITVGTHHSHGVPIKRVMELIGFVPIVQALPYKYLGDDEPPNMFIHPNGHLLGVNSARYPLTDYRERLLGNIQKLLDTSEGQLIVGGCGILEGGRRAYIQIALSDPIETPSGEKFTAWLLAHSSLDGTSSNVFQECMTRVLCRNTFHQATSERGVPKYSYRNTSKGKFDLISARQILDVFKHMKDDIQTQLDYELGIPCSDEQWDRIQEGVFPTSNDLALRTITVNSQNQQKLNELYYEDERIGKQYVGTMWGARQAFSTFRQWEVKPQEGLTTLGRNMTHMFRPAPTARGLTYFQAKEKEYEDVIRAVLIPV